VTAYNGAAYFVAADTTSWQLWRSDGTPEGTHVVKVINPGTNGSFPESLRVIDGLLYFTATELGVGRQLWRTDGTEAGTLRLTSVPGGVGDQATFAKHGDYVYFGAGRDDTGWELWRSDGTPEGTTLFKDINQDP
jgi:ELWxxDGT repeat protein